MRLLTNRLDTKVIAPQYILNEIEFLRYISYIMYEGDEFTSEEIKQMWEKDKSCSYKSVFGRTKISDLLGLRSGMYFNRDTQTWFTDPVKFDYHISKINWMNKEIYGKNYDRPWMFTDDIYLCPKASNL